MRRSKSKSISTLQMVKLELRRAFEHFGRPVTCPDFEKWADRRLSLTTIRRCFSSWSEAWASIGINIGDYPDYSRIHPLPPELRSKKWLSLAYNGDGTQFTPHSTWEIARHLHCEQKSVWQSMISLGIERRSRRASMRLMTRGLTKGPYPSLAEAAERSKRE